MGEIQSYTDGLQHSNNQGSSYLHGRHLLSWLADSAWFTVSEIVDGL
jgi:hypothetical protein